MERRKDQMSSFRDHERGFNRFKIAHFSDENDIRVLPQNVAQGVVERMRVGMHFALVDDAVAVVMQKFNRVFDGDDMRMAIPVDFINQRG